MDSQNKLIAEAIRQAGYTYVNCHINGTGGSVLPGKKAKEIFPDILKVTSDKLQTILISGTNGKTTTTKMIASLLQASGVECCYNREGANTEDGIVTTCVLNADIGGKPVSGTAAIECDELYVPQMMQILRPKVLVMLPLSEDQVDRLKSPENVAQKIRESLAGTDTVLCINSDCKYLESIAESCRGKNRIIYYSYENNKCVADNKSYSVELRTSTAFNYCNAAAAIAGVTAYGNDPEVGIKSLKHMKMPFGRMEHFCVNNHDAVISLVKNYVSMRNTFEYAASLHRSYRFVIGVNSSACDGCDLNWAETFPYKEYKELLNDVVVTGNGAVKVASAIEEAGISCRIITSDQEVVHYTECSNLPVFMMLNYTCMMSIREAFADRDYIQPFWEEPLPDVENPYSYSCIEVDLKEQRLRCFIDDRLKLECPVVSGRKTHETRPGTFHVFEMNKDRYLQSPDNGQMYYMNYWMAFDARDAGSGFHDCTWKLLPSDFNKKTHTLNGSMGCVYLRLDHMKKLYELSYPGMPVVIPGEGISLAEDHYIKKNYVEYIFSDKMVKSLYTMKPLGQWFYGSDESLQNYRYIAEQIDADLCDFVRPSQCNGDNVVQVSAQHKGSGILTEPVIKDADAMITDEKDVILCMVQSDCVPVYLFDSEKKVIGLVHSGRTGTQADIAGKTIKKMQEIYKCDPENIEVVIGPHICENCYCVDRDTAFNFLKEFPRDIHQRLIHQKDEKYYIDLSCAIIFQLERTGIRKENIKVSDQCTFESKMLYSYRGGDGSESSLSVICMR